MSYIILIVDIYNHHSVVKMIIIYDNHDYGVAMISRLLKIIGFFRRISSLSYRSSAKETYNFKEPTTCRHPSELHCVAVFCIVLQRVAVCCSVLQSHQTSFLN